MLDVDVGGLSAVVAVLGVRRVGDVELILTDHTVTDGRVEKSRIAHIHIHSNNRQFS
jgi:hypothetical protein